MSYTSLYIHIPFCPYICDYCAFYIIGKAKSTLRRSYLNRLEEELREKRELCHSLQTIYLGGGTPTFFSLAELEKLMTILNDQFRRSPDCEFTIECNPDSLTDEKVRILLDAGVNRFSLGVQSFSKRTRQIIGRHGNASRIYHAMEVLKTRSVKNFNCDLIYGIPGQTLDDWKIDLEKIIKLNPPHISTYALTVENNTPLFNQGVQEGNEDVMVSMWKLANIFLKNGIGLYRYEISNLAKPGFECRHNYRIWRGARFLGAGPAACYFDGRSRWTNPANITHWLQGEKPEEDYVPPPQRAIEILTTGLRTTAGWNREHFSQVTNFDFFELRGLKLNEFMQSGHISYENSTLRLTRKGMLLADYIGRELL